MTTMSLRRRSSLVMQHAIGRKGSPGTAGAVWYSGAVAPDAALGVDGDFHLNTATAVISKRELGVWVEQIDFDPAIAAAVGTAVDSKVNRAGDTMTGALSIASDYPNYGFNDTGGAADRKKTHFAYDAGVLGWHRYTDADAYIDTPFFLDYTGSATFANNLTAAHRITAEDLWLSKVNPYLFMKDTDGATANKRAFMNAIYDKTWDLAAYDDSVNWVRTLLTVNHDGGVVPTNWTTANRPASPANGTVGYNTTLGRLEAYVNGAWRVFGSGVKAEEYVSASAVSAVDIAVPTGAEFMRITGYITPSSTSASLNFRVATDGVPTFITAAEYGNSLHHMTGAGAYSGNAHATSTTHLLSAANNAANHPFRIVANIGQCVAGAVAPQWDFLVNSYSGGSNSTWSRGYRNQTGDISHVRFYPSTGTVTAKLFVEAW